MTSILVKLGILGSTQLKKEVVYVIPAPAYIDDWLFNSLPLVFIWQYFFSDASENCCSLQGDHSCKSWPGMVKCNLYFWRGGGGGEGGYVFLLLLAVHIWVDVFQWLSSFQLRQLCSFFNWVNMCPYLIGNPYGSSNSIAIVMDEEHIYVYLQQRFWCKVILLFMLSLTD